MATNDPITSVGEGSATRRPRPVAEVSSSAAASTAFDDGEKLIAEAEALAMFIARRGDMLGDDEGRKEAYKTLREALAAANAGNDDCFKGLLDAYARVSAFTYADYEVNGRTVLDTAGKGEFRTELNQKSARSSAIGRLCYRLQKPRNRPLLLGGVLLLMVGLFEGVLLIIASKTAHLELYKTMLGAKELLRPLVWGALGTCTFLMKKLSDKLSAFAFEEARARGMGTRVFLGAILGLIVVELVGKQVGQFPVYLIAFLAGLGIKPVYAAIESLVEGAAERIKPPKQGGKN